MTEPKLEGGRAVGVCGDEIRALIKLHIDRWRAEGVSEEEIRVRRMTLACEVAYTEAANVAAMKTRPAPFLIHSLPLLFKQIAEGAFALIGLPCDADFKGWMIGGPKPEARH